MVDAVSVMSLLEYVLDYLERCCPSAAKYMAPLADLQPHCPDAPDAVAKCAEPFSGDQHGRFPSTEIVLRGMDYFGAFRHHLSLSPTGFLMDFHSAFRYDIGMHLEAFGPSPRSRSSDLRS